MDGRPRYSPTKVVQQLDLSSKKIFTSERRRTKKDDSRKDTTELFWPFEDRCRFYRPICEYCSGHYRCVNRLTSLWA